MGVDPCLWRWMQGLQMRQQAAFRTWPSARLIPKHLPEHREIKSRTTTVTRADPIWHSEWEAAYHVKNAKHGRYEGGSST